MELKTCKQCSRNFNKDLLDENKNCPECRTETLTVDMIRDFQVCELYYRFMYLDEMPTPNNSRDLMATRFENTLKKVVTFFFYKKQSLNTPSYTALLNRWEKLWFPKDMTAYDLAVQQHELARNNMVAYSNNAAASLERFHREFADMDAVPIMVGEPFTMQIADKIRLSGTFDIVLRDGDDEFTIIKWISKRARYKNLMLDLAALKAAFRHRNDTAKKVRLLAYDVTEAASPFADVEQPGEADIRALYYWAQEARQTTEYVPRRGFTAYCKGCPFDAPCAEFADWPEAP